MKKSHEERPLGKYKWVPANLMLWVTLRRISIPSRRRFSHFVLLRKTGEKHQPGSDADFTFSLWGSTQRLQLAQSATWSVTAVTCDVTNSLVTIPRCVASQKSMCSIKVVFMVIHLRGNRFQCPYTVTINIIRTQT